MTVVHVAPTYAGPDSLVGGAERYVTELAKAMAKVVPTRLVSFGESPRQERWGALEVHIYKPWWYLAGVRSNPCSGAFVSSLRDAEVVHCHQFRVFSTTLSLLYARWRPRAVFVTDLGGGVGGVSHRLRLERWVRAFLSISEYAARDGGLPPGVPSVMIGGGVDTTVFQPRPVARERHVLFVGRVRFAKGLHLLLEALPPAVPLRVVGPILDQAYVERLRQAGPEKRVRFEPGCSDEVLRDHYARASVTVLPSLPGTELLGLTLLESMACGTPVICTRVGGMPEIVEDGVTGFVVPPNDPAALREKLEYLLAHPDIAQAMGVRGRAAAVARWTWEAVAARCLEAYRRYGGVS